MVQEHKMALEARHLRAQTLRENALRKAKEEEEKKKREEAAIQAEKERKIKEKADLKRETEKQRREQQIKRANGGILPSWWRDDMW